MSDRQVPDREVLGVGTIFGETFALVFGNLAPMLLIGLVPGVANFALNLLVYGIASQSLGLAVLDRSFATAATAGSGVVVVVLVFLAGLAACGFAGAALTRAAWDAATEGAVDVRGAIGTGIARFVPVTLWLVLGAIILHLSLFALLVPGLWLAGVWIALLPALAIERLGFAAFGRSAELTHGYRWPAAGLLLLFVLVAILMTLVAAAVQSAAYLTGTLGIAIGEVISLAISAISFALSCALVALAYARLREIKEGSGRSVAEVFA